LCTKVMPYYLYTVWVYGAENIDKFFS
jgi:hypothetical protein